MLLVFLLFFLSSSFDPNSIKFTLRSFRSLFCILAPMTWSVFCYQGEACRWCWLVRRSCLERGGIYYMTCYRFLERFSNDYQKADSKFITPTNHNRSKQHDEPSRISNDYREKWRACSLRGRRNRGRGRGARKPRKNEGDWGEGRGNFPLPNPPHFFSPLSLPFPFLDYAGHVD